MPSSRAYVVASVALVVAFGVLALLVGVGWSPLLRLDDRLVARIVRPTPAQQRPWRVVTDVLQPAVWRVGGVVAAVALAVRGRRREAVAVVGVVAVSLVLSTVLKAGVDRHRPSVAVYDAAGQSFPSGHALAAATVATALAVVVRRRWVSLAAVVLVAVTGASRLLLGVHYPSDVLGGVLLGCALGLTVGAVGLIPRGAR